MEENKEYDFLWTQCVNKRICYKQLFTKDALLDIGSRSSADKQLRIIADFLLMQ